MAALMAAAVEEV
jgi:hypothetical protein